MNATQTKRDNFLENLIETITEQTSYQGKITEGSRLREDIEIDPVQEIEIAIVLEEQFQTHLPDRVHRKWVTVKDALDYLLQHSPLTSL